MRPLNQTLTDRPERKIIIDYLRGLLKQLNAIDEEENELDGDDIASLPNPECGTVQASEDLAAAQKELADRKASLTSLRDEIGIRDERLVNLQNELDQTRRSVACRDKELAAANASLARANAKIADLEAVLLPDQKRLFDIQKMLTELSPAFRETAAMYYTLAVLPVFLVQCGQFARLRECWRSCGRLVADGANPDNIGPFLLACLDMYNEAIPEQKAAPHFRGKRRNF